MPEVLIFAFFAGQAAAFNPCGAAMFPAYVGYQLGTIDVSDTPGKAVKFAVLLGLSATTGFVAVFAVIGVVLASGGILVGKLLPFVGLGIGILISITGAWLLVSGQNIGIMTASRINLGQGTGYRNIFLFGIAYAIASLSCALPLFLVAAGIVVGQSLGSGGVTEAILGSASYGLGMGVVMIIASVAVVFFKEAAHRWIRWVMGYVEPVGKVAMILAGTYLIYYWSLGSGRELLTMRTQQLF